jgi:hypothetical protein
MEITRSLSKDGSLCPAAVNILGQIPPNALFFIAHQLRHPDSIYSLSLEKVGEAFTKVAEGYLSKMEEYRSNSQNNLEMPELLRDQESFLRALQEHLDDCYLILKTLVDPASALQSPVFADKYVIANKLPGAKSFQDALLDYKKTLRSANKLKHQQGRLRGVAIWLPSGPHLGYFLEEPDTHGQIGPSPEIHPDQGCISFARDLPWHLFNVYLCSEKLIAAISKALSGLYGTSPQPKVSTGNQKWGHIVSLASRIPQALFPKELRKHTATFRCDASRQTLTIKFPEHVRFSFPAQIKVTCSTVVDGHSTTFKVPFP